ncbi:MAG: hypothetical protein EPO65_12265 [Dehalococcoidia bacterium]|nr:MAG: hypothetical protein EPO65_12265 [Dehalococcoidia bacterium]
MIARVRQVAVDESGQALVLTAIFLLGLVAVAGLVADGGLVMVQRRDLQHVADAAAAAGAMQLDEATYRASSGAVVVLDPLAAEQSAVAYLIGETGTDHAVYADGAQVRVEVSRQATTAFLKVLGVTHVEISAHAVAAPRTGAGGP